MDLEAFCAVLGWVEDPYSSEKFREFQDLARALSRFDDTTLGRLAAS